MQRIMLSILLLLSCVSARGSIKISQFDLMTASSVVTADSFPMVDTTAGSTKRLRISDLFSVPALSNALAAKQASLPWTTNGDLVYYSSGAARLAIGSNGQYLQVVGGVPAWAALTGSGITTLNSQTGTTQTFAVGTSGSDFAISSSGNTHTFNLPDAGAAARGAVTTGAQTLAGVKTFSSAPILSSLTASYAVVTDGSKALASLQYTNANTASTLVQRDGSGNFAAGTITATLTGNVTGNVTGNADTSTALAANPSDCASDTYATTIAASGNLTCSTVTNAGLAGSIALTKLATQADQTIVGNTSGGAAAPIALTATQATAILNNMVGDSGAGGTKGLVPAPAAGDAAASKFLKADGTWAAAGGLSGLGSVDNVLVRTDGVAGNAAQGSDIVVSDKGSNLVTVNGSDVSSADATPGTHVTIRGGNKTSGTGGTQGGDVTIQGGNASGTSGARTGGSIVLNTGTTDSADPGTITFKNGGTTRYTISGNTLYGASGTSIGVSGGEFTYASGLIRATGHLSFVSDGTYSIGVDTPGPVPGLRPLDIHQTGAHSTLCASVSLTADNQNVTTANRSCIILSSDSAVAGDRTFTLSQSTTSGHRLTILWSGTNAAELVDDSAQGTAGNHRMSATWTPTQYDSVSFISNATDWHETARSTN